MKSHQDLPVPESMASMVFLVRQGRTSTCLWKWSLTFDQLCMVFFVLKKGLYKKPWCPVWVGLTSWRGRARLFWSCDVSHPPQEWRGSCMNAVCWGSKSRNNLFGTTELPLSSKLKSNLFLTLMLSSTTKSSWRPMTSSVRQGQWWGQ